MATTAMISDSDSGDISLTKAMAQPTVFGLHFCGN
jgi:hypothetical protein